MKDKTIDKHFVEYDKKTGIGDLLFVKIDSTVMCFRFCRIRSRAEECFILEFDDSTNDQYQISYYQDDKGKYGILQCQQWVLFNSSDDWKLISLNQPPCKLLLLLEKIDF